MYGKQCSKPYPPAARMRTLTWDRELEYVATIHSRQCNMTHDKCRHTLRFKRSGQNLGISSVLKTGNLTVEEFVVSILKSMYDEKDLTSACLRMIMCNEPEI